MISLVSGTKFAAHDAVDGVVIDRDARVPGATHDREHLGERGGVLHRRHVDARDHDLARDGVAHVDDLVNHRLLLVRQLVGVGHHVLDLLLGDALALVGGLDAQEGREAVSRLGGDPHERARHVHEAADGAGDGLGDGLGVGQRHALGHELAGDDGEVRDREGDEDGGEGLRDRLGHAETHEPASERVGEAGAREGGRREAHEGDGDLDGGEELL